MPKIAFSDVGLRSIKPPENGAADYWDERFPSFGMRVSQGGTKTFMLNIDKSRRTIGRFGIITLADARTEAKRLLAERTLGRFRPQSISFETAFDAFIAEKEKSRRARTIKDYKRLINLHFRFKGQLADVKHDARKARGPVGATPSVHAHALIVLADHESVSVILDLVDPIRPHRRLRCLGRDAGSMKPEAGRTREPDRQCMIAI